MGVKYIILAKESDYKRYGYITRQMNLQPVVETSEITLYRNTGFGQ